MATLEDRVSAREEVLEHDFANPLRAMTIKIDELSRDVRDQGRELREQSQEMHEFKARLALVDTRLKGAPYYANHSPTKRRHVFH